MRKNIVTPTEYVVELETELAYKLQVVHTLTKDQNARYAAIMGKIELAKKGGVSMTRATIALDVRYILEDAGANDFGGGVSASVGSTIDRSRKRTPDDAYED